MPINFGQFTGGQKATPTITWNKPADIFYGTSLSSTKLNAVATRSCNWKCGSWNLCLYSCSRNKTKCRRKSDIAYRFYTYRHWKI
jgi:hypothetical protein